MENPYVILGVSANNNIYQEINERFERISTQKKNIDNYIEEMFRENKSITGKTRNADTRILEENFADELVEDFADIFVCNTIPKERYMSNISEFKDAIEIQENIEKTGTANDRFYMTVLSQKQKLDKAYEYYKKVLTDYIEYKNFNFIVENKDSKEEKIALIDLYIKMKFEDEVAKVCSEVAMKTNRSFNSEEDKMEFKSRLLQNPKFIKLRDAYEKINSQTKRYEFDPKLYMQEIERNSKKPLVLEEQQPKKASNERQNSNWGIASVEPTTIMKDVRVKNLDFDGKVTVKHLGFFSANQFFQKRKKIKEKNKKIRILKYTIPIDGERTRRLTLEVHDPAQDMAKGIRKSKYMSEATKQLYSNIYLVSKTNSNGETREEIVFSPIEKDEFGKKYSESFIANVYFSDYMLDVAKKNGGFVGSIEKDRYSHSSTMAYDGLYISTYYNEDEINAARAYQEGRVGLFKEKIKGKWNSAKKMSNWRVDSKLKRKANERERTIDE